MVAELLLRSVGARPSVRTRTTSGGGTWTSATRQRSPLVRFGSRTATGRQDPLVVGGAQRLIAAALPSRETPGRWPPTLPRRPPGTHAECERAFALFKGACQRGIYDNMKTAVETVFIGKDRQYNRRFLQMCSHHLVEPVACTPASGWEKGQVENQVGLVRERFFSPKPRFKNYDELNAWLLDKCLAWAKSHPHPERPERTIWEAFQEERPKLIPYRGPFDGFHALPASVSKTCLVRFDNNKYSVSASAVGRPVDVYAYADRIVVRQDGRVVGEHPRCYGRGETIYDPWHYVPVLARKPGALRNGAPFKDWVLPAAWSGFAASSPAPTTATGRWSKSSSAVLTDGLPAVEAACAQALTEGVHSADVILNILARRRDPGPAVPIETPASLALRHAPIADCARYDALRRA